MREAAVLESQPGMGVVDCPGAMGLMLAIHQPNAAIIDERTNHPKTNGLDAFASRPRPTRRGMKREAAERPRTAWVHRAGRLPVSVAGASPAPARGCSTVDIHGRSTDGSHLAFRRRRPGGGSRAKCGQFVANFGQAGTGLARRARMTQARLGAPLARRKTNLRRAEWPARLPSSRMNLPSAPITSRRCRASATTCTGLLPARR